MYNVLKTGPEGIMLAPTCPVTRDAFEFVQAEDVSSILRDPRVLTIFPVKAAWGGEWLSKGASPLQ